MHHLTIRSPIRVGGVACLAGALALSACSVGGSSGDEAGSTTQTKKVVIVTHDSWAAPKKLIRQFEQQSGYEVTIAPSGDAGELTNKLVLTKDNPIADGVYGIDNTFGSRAVDEGVLADYRSEVVDTSEYDLPGGEKQLTPIDWGDVCVNVDDAWLRDHKVAAPTGLDDLVKPAYKGLFVTPGAASSSPGFAFLLATIGKYGEDGWQGYWKKLIANDTKLTSGWTDAYEVDFSASGGSRPLVVSYNSSPPFTIPKGDTKPTTSALLDTCFRQIEYAGVLSGAKNPDGAEAFVDFMLGKAFQEALPDNMYVFPVNPDATLPPLWAKWAPAATSPITVDPAEITANRQQWLTEWADLTS
ncbi:MAG: thiamine ABC transporter substrate-binding protein [Nocardioidaceae bacterium]